MRPHASEKLVTGREMEVGLGVDPLLRLGVRVARRRSWDPDHFFLLADQANHSRTALELTGGDIRAVRVRRMENVPRCSYTLVNGAFVAGGAGDDLLVKGAPRGWLWLARWERVLYVFQPGSAERTWRHAELGETFHCGETTLGLREGGPQATIAEPGLE